MTPLNPAVLVHTIRSARQWHAMRFSHVGASEVAALLTDHKYLTRRELWDRKRGLVPESGDSRLFRRGNLLERSVAVGVKMERPKWRIRTTRHYLSHAELRLGATPDFYVHDGEAWGPLQTKTVDPAIFEDEWTALAPPAWISIQALAESYLLGASVAYVAAMVLTRDFPIHIYRVPRHTGIESRMAAEVAAFWESLANDNPPPFTIGRDAEAIMRAFPRVAREDFADLSRDNRIGALLEEREALKQAESAGRKRLKEIDEDIKAKIGDAPGAIVPGWNVLYPEWSKDGYFVEPSSGRTLKIRRNGQRK